MKEGVKEDDREGHDDGGLMASRPGSSASHTQNRWMQNDRAARGKNTRQVWQNGDPLLVSMNVALQDPDACHGFRATRPPAFSSTDASAVPIRLRARRSTAVASLEAAVTSTRQICSAANFQPSEARLAFPHRVAI